MFNKFLNSKHFLNLLAVVLFCSISIMVFSSNFIAYGSNVQQNAEEKNKAGEKPTTFGILVPLEHAALKDIVDGFKSEVKKQYPDAIFNVQNAQGDIKLQRTIIEQFVGQKVDIIVPIGTTSTLMTLSYVKTLPIVSLAAEYSETERQKRHPRNITGVLDEIGGQKKIKFIKQIYPDLKKLTIIYHSGNEKNFSEVEEIELYGKKFDIAVQKLSIHTLPELESTVQAIDKDSQAILILKDHLIASGIRLLTPTAEAKSIPLISSDEGSVQEGASFALGMQERAIGEAGGHLAIKIIEGQDIANLPMQDVNNLAIFYNAAAFKKQSPLLDLQKLQEISKQDGYLLIAK